MAWDNVGKASAAVKLAAFAVFTVALFFILTSKPKVSPEKAKITENVKYKTYGGYKADRTWGLLDAEDGIIIYGDTASFGAGGYDMYFLKTDYEGALQFSRTFGGSANESLIKVLKTQDGYILAGGTESFGNGGTDGYALKISRDGDKIWEITRGGENFDYFYGAAEVQDGYVFCGYSSSFGSKGNSDAYAVKTNRNGELQWYKTYGGDKWDIFYSVQAVKDGLVFLGYTDSFGGGQTDIYIVKTDFKGNKKWEKYLGGIRQDIGCSLIVSGDKGFVIAGKTTSYISRGFGWDAVIIKTDSEGNSLWSRVIPASEFDPSCVFFEKEKYIYSAGQKKCYGICDSEVYVIKTDAYGNTINEKYLSAIKDDMASGIIIHNGAYYISGTTLSYGKGLGDIFLSKLDQNFKQIW